jgi:broad specificity phosphatase PhoE
MTERILYLVRHGESDFDSRDFTATQAAREPGGRYPITSYGQA